MNFKMCTRFSLCEKRILYMLICVVIKSYKIFSFGLAHHHEFRLQYIVYIILCIIEIFFTDKILIKIVEILVRNIVIIFFF